MKLQLLFLTALLAGCPTLGPVPPTPPDAGEDPDPEVDAATPATCANWCARATKLKCQSAKTTPNGTPCITVCDNLQRSGVVTWNLHCRIAARSCAAADACEK